MPDDVGIKSGVRSANDADDADDARNNANDGDNAKANADAAEALNKVLRKRRPMRMFRGMPVLK